MNLQVIEKSVTHDEDALDIQDVFYTIQGEGPLVGYPSVFVRLAGCNLQCPLCDTDYTTNRKMWPIRNIVSTVCLLAKRSYGAPLGSMGLAVITGGEPFRQSNVFHLARALHSRGITSQFETNGLYPLRDLGHYMVVCSPKTPLIHPTVMEEASALKYVLEAGHVGSDGLPTSVLGKPICPARPNSTFKGDIFVSPVDSKDPEINKRNVDAAVDSCMKYGYRLSIQTHKIAGVP